MRKIVLTFGLIGGAMLSVMMLLTVPFMDQIGYSKGAIIGYTSMVLAFLMVYFGVRSYRDHVLGGTIGFGRAFATGLLITLVASVCYVVTWEYVYFNITPDFIDQYSAYAIDQARQSGATDAVVAAKAKEMAEFKAMYKHPLVIAAFTLLEPLPVGLLFTLVSAALLGPLARRRRAS